MPVITRIKDKIINWAPVDFLLKKSKSTSFPGFRGIPLYDVMLFFYGQVKAGALNERAYAIAFNVVMAIPPAFIFLFTLIPFFPVPRRLEEELYALIRDIIPGQQNNSYLINFLHDVINNPRNGLLSLGFVLSLFFSSNAMIGVMRSFDKNYIGFTKRNPLQKRLVAIKLTCVLFVLVIMSVLLIIAREAVLSWLGIENRLVISIITNLRWLIIGILFFLSISFIYRQAPSVQKKWRLVSPGSIVATFLMIVLTLCFSWYVNNFANFNKLYGSLGTILILMLIIYLNSLVLLIGFELNVSISSLKKIADERKNNLSGGMEN